VDECLEKLSRPLGLVVMDAPSRPIETRGDTPSPSSQFVALNSQKSNGVKRVT
jgi:hypothetical protein